MMWTLKCQTPASVILCELSWELNMNSCTSGALHVGSMILHVRTLEINYGKHSLMVAMALSVQCIREHGIIAMVLWTY